MAEKFHQIDGSHQTTNLGSSENVMQANSKKSTLRPIVFKPQKVKENILKKPEEISTLLVEGQG